MAPAPEASAPAAVVQHKQADGGWSPGGSAKRKPRMRPMKLRRQREKQSRKTIRSFRSRCTTA